MPEVDTHFREALAIGKKGTFDQVVSSTIIDRVNEAARTYGLEEGSPAWRVFRRAAFNAALDSADKAAQLCGECLYHIPAGQIMIYCTSCGRCEKHCRCLIVQEKRR
jgi:hypothetical protein